jgi:hypothetical protein
MTKTFHPGAQASAQPKAWPTVAADLIYIAVFLLVLLMPMVSKAWGQALPAAEASPISTGFALPHAEGTLQYGVSASEGFTTGFYGGPKWDSGSSLSGDVAYISNSRADPFSMVFSGGRSWSTSGQPSYDFLNLALSQVITTRLWTLVLGDSPHYSPATATTGLSGVPGVGDLGVEPIQAGTDTGQGILTNYSSRVSNSSYASLQLHLTGKTSFSASGTYSFTRFLDDSDNSNDNGLNSTVESGSGGLGYRIDARNSVSGSYSYSSFTYSEGEPGFASQTASLMYSHQFTRKFGVSMSAGPQWTDLNLSGNPISLSLYAQASANYAAKFSHMSLAFVRSANSGYGVIAGAVSDSVSFSIGRTFARVWNCSANAAYVQSAGLTGAEAGNFSSQTVFGGVQLSRALMRSLSTFASYTLLHQFNTGSADAVDLYSGLTQVASFGLTYSPTAFHLGHQ